MKALLICDDQYHPGQIVIDGLAPLTEKGCEFDIVIDGLDVNPLSFYNYPVVILSKCDEATPSNRVSWASQEVQQGFVDYVENGGGLLTIHSGLVAGENTNLLHGLIGSRFKWHPHEIEVTAGPLKAHLITEGVGQFTEVDEHYYLELLKNDMDVLMASFSPSQGNVENYEFDSYHNCPQKIEPCAYVRLQGRGRVCVLTPGHNLNVWLNPNFQKLLHNSLRWCSGEGGSNISFCHNQDIDFLLSDETPY